MARRTPVLVISALLLAGACTSGSTEAEQHLSQLLLPEGPAGYEMVDAPASGPMDLGTAGRATSLDPVQLRRQLGRTGFQRGYSRVWRLKEAKDEFVVVLVFEFLTEKRAQELVSYAGDQHARKISAARFTVGEIPRAEGIILNARSPDGKTSLFCQLVWFADHTLAFEVRVCSAQPSTVDQAVALAGEQLKRARGAPES